jgi:hypothetical protein
MTIEMARPGSYRPPLAGRYRPVGPMRKAAAQSMRKLSKDIETRHPDMGAHQHIKDAADALERNQPEGAARHLNAAIGNMTPQSLRRHGLLTDEHHDAAKRSMDAIHRHLLLVKDVQDVQQHNEQLPRQNAEGDQADDGLDEKPAADDPSSKAMNVQVKISAGRHDPNVAKPQQVTDPGKAKQVAASNSGGRAIDLSLLHHFDPAELRGPDGKWKAGAAGKVAERMRSARDSMVGHKAYGLAAYNLGMAANGVNRGLRNSEVQHSLKGAADRMDEIPAGQRDPDHARMRASVQQFGDALNGIENGTPTMTLGQLASKQGVSLNILDNSVELSAQTGRLATVSTPISGSPGGPGLWHVKGMGLPPYIRNIAKALMRKRGMPESQAIAIARASTKKWKTSKHPEVAAAATAADADWRAKQARAHSHSNEGPMDFTGDGHGHHVAGTPDVYSHGYKLLKGASATARAKAGADHARAKTPANTLARAGADRASRTDPVSDMVKRMKASGLASDGDIARVVKEKTGQVIRVPKAGDELPSKGFSSPGALKAGKLTAGDKVLGSYGAGGPANLKMHNVTGVKHQTTLTVRHTVTGKTHTQVINSSHARDDGKQFGQTRAGDKLQGHYRGDAPGKTAEYEVVKAQHHTILKTADPDTGEEHVQKLHSGTNVQMSRSVSRINAASKRTQAAGRAKAAATRAARRTASMSNGYELASHFNPAQPRDPHSGKWANAGLNIGRNKGAFSPPGAHDPASMIAVGGGRKNWGDEASQMPDPLARKNHPAVAARMRQITPRRLLAAQMDESRISSGRKPLHPELASIWPSVYAKAGIKGGSPSALKAPKPPRVKPDSYKVTGLDSSSQVTYVKMGVKQMLDGSNTLDRALLFTGTAAGAAQDKRIPAGQPGGGTFGSGQGGAAKGKAPAKGKTAAKPAAKKPSGNAAKKAALVKKAAGYRTQADALIKQRDALRAAQASASGKTSTGQAGAKTSSQAGSTTSSTAPASTAPAASSTPAATSKSATPAKAAATPSKAAATAQIAALNKQIVGLQQQYRQAMAQAKAL